MQFFEYDRDYFQSVWTAQSLTLGAALAILLLAVVFIGLHLLRRGFGAPRRRADGKGPPEGQGSFLRYELGARLYHWGNALVFLVLIVSAIALFVPGMIPHPWISWLLVHEIAAGLFIALLILHIVFAFWRANPRTMWFERGDGESLKHSIKYGVYAERELPSQGKYDPWQKINHAVLTLVMLVLIATGASLFLSAHAFYFLDHEWLRWQRLIHQGGALLIGLFVLLHLYIRLLPEHWEALRSMFTGRISRREFEAKHDWSRWQPEEGQASGRSGAEPHKEERVEP